MATRSPSGARLGDVEHRIIVPAHLLAVAILGPGDEVLRAVEAGFPTVRVHARGDQITLTGLPADVGLVTRLLDELLEVAAVSIRTDRATTSAVSGVSVAATSSNSSSRSVTSPTSAGGPVRVIWSPRACTRTFGKPASTARSTSSPGPRIATAGRCAGTMIRCSTSPSPAPEGDVVAMGTAATTGPPRCLVDAAHRSGRVPGGAQAGDQPRRCPPMTCPCAWNTDCPDATPVLKISRNWPPASASATSLASLM